jgi:uncharacterized protein YdaU (DUF1376 family)
VTNPLGNQSVSGDNRSASDAVQASSAPLTDPCEVVAEMANPDSTSGRAPAFQFYPKDFLTDSNVVVMSMAERGAYITLICSCWIDGSIPVDVARLARLCGTSTAAFRKLWPALAPCFRPTRRISDRLIHPRLEREREKQAIFREEQSRKGKASAAARNRKATGRQPEINIGSTVVQPITVQPKPNSSIFDLQSSISNLRSAEDVPALADARSKRPIFKGQRFVIFEWQLDDLRRLLGLAFDAFDVHAWFFELDARAAAADLAVPQRDGGKWLQEQTLEEAAKRGIAIATTHQGTGKTAGNLAAAARFVARGRA